VLIIIIYFSADIIPSATPADQPVVPSASASQRREIALKQVSHLISIFIITSAWSSNNLFYFLFQEQDSPHNKFSFAIEISDDEGEEASSSQAVGISSAEIRAKLEDLEALLRQDTAQLVNDSDPAKALFKALRVQIPADAEDTVDTVFWHVSLGTCIELMKRRSADWAMVASLQGSCQWRMVPMEKQLSVAKSRSGDADDQC